MSASSAGSQAALFGVPLRIVSLVTLTAQNSLLTIILHQSRVVVPNDRMYSAASAVLLSELLKGSVSLSTAFFKTLHAQSNPHLAGVSYSPVAHSSSTFSSTAGKDVENGREKAKPGREVVGPKDLAFWELDKIVNASYVLRRNVLSRDCWKLSIPAILYVLQNNLQFVAASNLDVPTFQVSYNLKILTTALFSVLLLGRRLSQRKWVALTCLGIGVAIVQLQSSSSGGKSSHPEHEMNRFKGLSAVLFACMTSGLAGVYFEMVLKGSKVDLWIRNVQLSFFSIIPALLPVFLPDYSLSGPSASAPKLDTRMFAHFGFWAWSVVLCQVAGGLLTALVIKYSDNILKGFATSLAIIISFLAGVILFSFRITASFVFGSGMVMAATYLYNQPDAPSTSFSTGSPVLPRPLTGRFNGAGASSKGAYVPLPTSETPLQQQGGNATSIDFRSSSMSRSQRRGTLVATNGSLTAGGGAAASSSSEEDQQNGTLKRSDSTTILMDAADGMGPLSSISGANSTHG